MLVRMVFTPPMGNIAEQAALLIANLLVDLEILHVIRNTRYLLPRTPIPKHSNLNLVEEYSQDILFQDRFESMLRVSPYVYEVLINLISGHAVFQNQSHNRQTPVWIQLAITLYRLGHYGNSASVRDVAQNFGFSEGGVEKFTRRCFAALESFHNAVVRPLTEQEKEVEKEWIDAHVGFRGLWREGWVMYDGTIAVLHERPGFNGNAYFTRKSNYGLNVQVCGSTAVEDVCRLMHDRLEMFPRTSALSTTATASLVPHMTLRHSNTPLQPAFQIGSSMAKNLRGSTLPIH